VERTYSRHLKDFPFNLSQKIIRNQATLVKNLVYHSAKTFPISILQLIPDSLPIIRFLAVLVSRCKIFANCLSLLVDFAKEAC
jgi:hypothetical protein